MSSKTLTALVAPQPQQVLVRALALRGIALAGLCAHVSLWLQIDGLFGVDGIAPIGASLQKFMQTQDGADFHLAPTLLWLLPTDAAMHGLCAIGSLACVAVLGGLAPRLPLAVAFATMLSLVTAADDFMSFQWDALLLEALFLAIWLAPRGLCKPQQDGGPTQLSLWLLRWLALRLYLLSALVKWLSGDPTWHDLTALQYHYWTQPLPGPLSWFADAMPASGHTFEAAFLFFAEGLAPLLVFMGRRLRLLGVAVMLLLQLGIASTGNYGFFNLLTVALLLTLLDDGAIIALLPKRLRPLPLLPIVVPQQPFWRRLTHGLSASLLLVLASLTTLHRVNRDLLPEAMEAALAWLHPLHISNTYGLFATMTTERPEIEVELSLDGQKWELLQFQYKISDMHQRPPLVGPHMPRLDWQMWFAALGNCEKNHWFVKFQRRLLLGSKPVRALLAVDPLQGQPARYVRSTLWQYQFAPWPDLRDKHIWWQRQRVGAYCPTLTLEDGHLVRARVVNEATIR